MSTIVILLSLLFACLIVIGSYTGYRMRRHLPFTKPSFAVMHARERTLTHDERAAIERYLTLANLQLSASSTLPVLQRTRQDPRVYVLTHSITRYGLTTNTANKWRYFIDTQEIHLPADWEQYITENNHIELINTRSIPLVVALNGHSLSECVEHSDQSILPPPVIPERNASIREEGNERAELVAVRKETQEEYAVHHASGIRESLLISLAFLLFFISLMTPLAVMPWLAAAAVLLAAWSCWQLFRAPSERELQEVHCLNGTPQCLGLFGESNQEQIGNISLGNIDLIYPPHWQPYIAYDLAQKTQVDIYLNRQVVRQGEFLSLHEEVSRFPLQRFGKNLILSAGALLPLILLLSFLPLKLPLNLSMSWLHGAQNIKVVQVDELQNAHLKIGDKLDIQSTGMCDVPAGNRYPSNVKPYAFTPFDCSAIYWNKAGSLPLPESDVIEKASALLSVVNAQLHPVANGEGKVSTQLASAIQKSGMVLLNNFSDIVLKTQELCTREEDCTRLKNALVNLGNVKTWDALVRRAKSGSLKGMNVLLRSVNAESLESLVVSATESFFYQEINAATDSLNSPPPSGFLIRSDEGRQLVNYPLPPKPFNEYHATEQWQELQRLSAMLLHTPFSAKGVITQLSTDANGTQHINLRSDPDAITPWRYFGTGLLMLVLSVVLVANLALMLVKMRKSQQRERDIKQYYDACFSTRLATPILMEGRAYRMND
ncbi:IgaA/UmoB family intracellular growth attenuator [Symbiopectobacterium sp. Eva_TO]